MNKLSQELIDSIVALREQGRTFSAIALELQITQGQAEYAARLGGAVKPKLSPKQKEEIRHKRMNGASRKELAAEYGVAEATISETTKDLDLTHLKTDVDGVVQDYKAGLSHREIGIKYGLTTRSVASVLARAGVQKKTMSEDMRQSMINDRLSGMSRKELSAKYGLSEAGVKSSLGRDGIVVSSDVRSKNAGTGIVRAHLRAKGVDSHAALMQVYAAQNGGEYVGGYSGVLELATWKCSRGHQFEMRPNTIQQGGWCARCAHVGPSKGQLELVDFVKSLGVPVEVGNRSVIKPLELDLWVPSKNLGIEYNGLIWHSDKFQETGRHHRKAMACRDRGIELLAIFEDEWYNKRPLVEAMIRHRLGILGTKLRASKLEVRRMGRNIEFREFFDRNHLDGHANASYAYGLFLGDRLVSCMSIRTNYRGECEIARFATDYDYHVYGGASKLIGAIRQQEVRSIVTFSNNRLSVGGTYQKLGFRLVQENKPSYWYTDGKERIWRFRCRRINDPRVLEKFPGVPHTERDQARAGVFSMEIWGDRRPLWKVEDYGHRKWVLDQVI